MFALFVVLPDCHGLCIKTESLMLALIVVVVDFNLAMTILNWAIHLKPNEMSGYKTARNGLEKKKSQSVGI